MEMVGKELGGRWRGAGRGSCRRAKRWGFGGIRGGDRRLTAPEAREAKAREEIRWKGRTI